MPTEALFRGGAKSSNKIAYICRDCGYIYEGREAFEGLDKSYRCPVCQAPKRRCAQTDKTIVSLINSQVSGNISGRPDSHAPLAGSQSTLSQCKRAPITRQLGKRGKLSCKLAG